LIVCAAWAAALVIPFLVASCATEPPKKRSISIAACVQPDYPPRARRAEATGTTRLRIEVTADGTVTEVSVLRPSGPTREHKMLDQAAVDALRHCKFAPEPGTTTNAVTVSYRWSLYP
jgi:periplasmic protein TonB